MDKYMGQLYERLVRGSQSGGDPKTHRVDQEAVETLGQGMKAFFMFRIYKLDAGCEVVIRVYHGCLGAERPADSGFPVTLDTPTSTGVTSVTLTTAGVHLVWTAEDLMALVEPTVDVRHATASSTVEAEYEGWATVLPYR